MLSFLKYLLVTALLLAVTIAGGYFYVVGRLDAIDSAPIRKVDVYTVAPGTSPQKVVDDLALRPENRYLYRLWFRLNPEFAALKAGTYSLGKAQNLRQALELLCAGRELAFHFTVVEGTRYEQIIARLAREKDLVMDLEDGKVPEFFALNPNNPEGLLFAESYSYTAGDKASAVLKRSYTDLARYLDAQWKSRDDDLPLKTPYEALILASIVEKETARSGEYQLVASVFVNRLNRRMKLQSDPTTIYGIKDRYDGNIRRRDLEDVNPYNTNVIPALPPTPIAVASKAAIHAALHPAHTDYLYFVADGSGGHTFSRTLAEHNRAVSQYVKLQREQKKQKKAAAESEASQHAASAEEESGTADSDDAADGPDGGAAAGAHDSGKSPGAAPSKPSGATKPASASRRSASARAGGHRAGGRSGSRRRAGHR